MLAGMDARTLDRRMRAVARVQHALIGRDQLRGEGITRQAVLRRLRSPDWEALTARVLRLVGSPATAEQWAMAATLDAGPGTVLSHGSAAGLWGVPGFDLRHLHVSRTRSGTRRPTALAVVHQPSSLPAHHRAVRHGIPVTTLARTVVDLAVSEHATRVERAAHAAVRMGVRWSAFEGVLAELGDGRPGSALIGSLVAANRGRAPLGSGLEGTVLRLLASAGLPEPRRQVDLGGHEWIGRVDFLYEEQRLVIEVDGAWCHEGALEVRRDKRRTAALVAAGFRVLPLAEDLIRNAPAEVVRLVRDALRGAA